MNYSGIVAVSFSDPNCESQAKRIADQYHLPLVSKLNSLYSYFLIVTPERLELHSGIKKLKPIYVDFLGGKIGYRLKSSGHGLISKAVGFQKNQKCSVLDVTAGLGQDGFLLAGLGCEVTLIERSPIIYLLLEDGLRRLFQENEFQPVSIQLIHADSREYLQKIGKDYDVIYLDPMYSSDKRTALSKKEMQVLREIVGEDLDASELLNLAKSKAKKRVIVKRHRYAANLAEQKPDLAYTGQSSRFDVYLQF